MTNRQTQQAAAGTLDRGSLYPLRFEPIYQHRLWGGRRLGSLLSAPLPDDGPFGEAWLLSDRNDHPSVVADGPLKGSTLGQLFEAVPEQLLGRLAGRFRRFPLLLKFLDAHEMLSVQVHPTDLDVDLIPMGETGKTEAWVVLEAGLESRIYVGLKPGTTKEELHQAITHGDVVDHLVGFTPKIGDGVFIPAGTVHSLGHDVMVFEVQQNSDVTFRLYDWNHVDAKTGQPRALQVEQALACTDFSKGRGGLMTSDVALSTVEQIIAFNEYALAAPGLVIPDVETVTPVERESLFQCDQFWLWRLRGESPFTIGVEGAPRVLVCLEGAGLVEHNDVAYAVGRGDVLLLPAEVGACTFRPLRRVDLLEIAIPDESFRLHQR